MKTDRELLEAAAKAAGIDGEYRTEHLCVGGDWMDVTAIFLADRMGWWNPLTDDGDALRLAVRLQLTVCNEHLTAGVVYCTRGEDSLSVVVSGTTADAEVLPEDYVATRRAIVEAAAAMANKTQNVELKGGPL